MAHAFANLSSGWSREEVDSQTEALDDASIPLLLNEVRQHYDVDEIDTQSPRDQRTTDNANSSMTALNEAIDNIERNNSTSCAFCSEEIPIQDVSTFERAQHLSMPGQYFNKYHGATRTLKHAYKHHAIVKQVKHTSGMKAELVLIHFTSGGPNNEFEVYQTTETFDLRQTDIYLVDYKHPRYLPDEIIRRAESMLPENRTCRTQFDSYDLASSNCEHFATWCVVGDGESFQVQGVKQKIISGLKTIFGTSSLITKGLTRLIFNSADEIATAMNGSINAAEIVLGAAAAIYLLYCIVKTVIDVRTYRKGHMCRSCLRSQMIDLWGAFAMFGATSIATFLVIHFALPLLGLGPFGVPLVILMVLLSIALQWSVPKIRRLLQSPFQVDRNRISSLSSVQIGDIISFYYYGFEHVAVATEIDETYHLVRCVHYALPSLLGTRIVQEGTFNLDPSKNTVKLFDCSPLQCRPRHEVVEMARKRVGETKWSPVNRSDHVCFWAKVKTPPRGPCLDMDYTPSSPTVRASAFIREEDVHLMTDLRLGDVVTHKTWRGILVKLDTLDNNYGRKSKIDMIVYGFGWRVCRKSYTIDLDKNHVSVEHYNPATCFPMSTRVQRALAFEGKKGEWWKTKDFITHCIMLPQ